MLHLAESIPWNLFLLKREQIPVLIRVSSKRNFFSLYFFCIFVWLQTGRALWPFYLSSSLLLSEAPPPLPPPRVPSEIRTYTLRQAGTLTNEPNPITYTTRIMEVILLPADHCAVQLLTRLVCKGCILNELFHRRKKSRFLPVHPSLSSLKLQLTGIGGGGGLGRVGNCDEKEAWSCDHMNTLLAIIHIVF